MKIAIIGAGLAGTACAYILKQAGLNPEIYEAGADIALGASGNALGLINPRLSAHRSPESDYFTSAFASGVRLFDSIAPEIDWHKCGALHLMIDDKKDKRFPQTAENWGWPADEMCMVNANEASVIAGIPLKLDALYLKSSGHVNPQKLCRLYARNIKTHMNTRIENLADIKADITILACANGLANFSQTSWIPMQSVRGQITQMRAPPSSLIRNLRCNLGYGGYCSPPDQDGNFTLGATFQRWLDHTELMDEDDRDNIAGLARATGIETRHLEMTGRRAALRASSKDHFPIAGRLPGHNNIYISAAHGSHGIISSLAAAILIKDMILEYPLSQSKFTVNALKPSRFMDI